MMQIDMTRPSTARILDYWMGGVHNFEIDRQFADQLAGMMPILAQLQKINRAALRRVVTRFIRDFGLRVFADFGAGLPTCENTHLVAQQIDPTVRVLYSDIDSLTAEYGRQIVTATPNTAYVQGDAATPRAILESEPAKTLLRGTRRIGVIHMLLGHLLTAEQLGKSARDLYDWCAPGSYWFFTVASEQWETVPELQRIREFSARAGVPYHMRTVQEILDLLAPWQLIENGLTCNSQVGLPDPDPNPFPIYTREFILTR